MITYISNKKNSKYFFQLYLLLLSLNLFLAFIKLVNFFEAQMVIPPMLGVPRIRIELFSSYVDSHVFFITIIMLLFISISCIKLPKLSVRITVFASLLSLIGIAYGMLNLVEVHQIYIELLLSFLMFSIVLTLILIPRDTQFKKNFIISLVSYVSAIIVSIQLVALCHWLKKPWVNVELMSHGALVEYQLFMSPLLFASLLLTAFLFSWLWIPLAQKIWVKYSPFNVNILAKSAERGETNNSGYELYLLIIFSILSMVVGYYPYFGMKEGTLIGIDTPRYYAAFEKMRETGPQAVLGKGRELFSLFIWVLQQFMTSENALRICVVFNAFFILFTTVLLMKGRGRNRRLITASLSIFSITNVVGGTVGLLTNWFTLSLWYITFAFLLWFFEKGSKFMFMCAFVASVAAMFSHTWTWDILILIIFIYGIFSLLFRRIAWKEFAYIVVFLVLNGVVRFIYFMLLSKQSGYIISESTRLSSNVFRLSLILSYIPKVRHLTTLSPQYSNFLVPLLGIIGLIMMFKRKKVFDRLIISWIFICSLGVYASSISGSNIWMPESHAWRFLYLVPFHIPAAEGIIVIIRKIRRFSPSILKPDVKDFLFRYGVIMMAAPLFSQLNFMSLLIVPFGLFLTLLRLINKKIMIDIDVLMVILLALFNYTLRALTAGWVLVLP